jgi:hypothetical protein
MEKTYGIFVVNARTKTTKRAFPGTNFTNLHMAARFAEFLDQQSLGKGKVHLTYLPKEVDEVDAVSSFAASLGSRGGKSTSEAKRKASAENGKLGGRPRKQE